MRTVLVATITCDDDATANDVRDAIADTIASASVGVLHIAFSTYDDDGDDDA